jgi:prefoldin subunit 5
MRFLFPLAIGACAIALLVGSASAPAATRTLKGQVVGSAYQSGSRMVVPALLDARSARRARLRTPLVRLLVPRTSKVRVPGRTTVLPQYLRTGDAFSARAAVARSATRAAFPALPLRAGALAVTRRGTTLSAAELQEQLGALSAYVNQLTAYVLAQFADLRAQLAALRADLAGLRGSMDALSARLTQVEGSLGTLQGQLTTLVQQVSTLETQLQSLTTQLSAVTSDLAAVQQLLTGIAPGDLAQALSDIAALETLVGGINVGTLSAQVSALATKVGNVGSTDLQTQVDQANATLAAVQQDLTFLCTSAELVKGNLALGLLGLSNLSACP